MKKFTVLFSIVALTVGGQVASAYPGEVVSYHENLASGGVLVASVPTGGLVVTDIVFLALDGSCQWSLIEDDGATSKSNFTARTTSDGAGLTDSPLYSLNSGIPFAEGNQIKLSHCGSGGREVTISGYIPDPSLNGTVPAVGTWGLFIMGLLVISGATILIARRKPVVA